MASLRSFKLFHVLLGFSLLLLLGDGAAGQFWRMHDWLSSSMIAVATVLLFAAVVVMPGPDDPGRSVRRETLTWHLGVVASWTGGIAYLAALPVLPSAAQWTPKQVGHLGAVIMVACYIIGRVLEGTAISPRPPRGPGLLDQYEGGSSAP
jgi:hypothetical protein